MRLSRPSVGNSLIRVVEHGERALNFVDQLRRGAKAVAPGTTVLRPKRALQASKAIISAAGFADTRRNDPRALMAAMCTRLFDLT